MSLKTLFGNKVRLIGRRYFAIPKPASLSERIHASTLLYGSLPKWERVMHSPVGSTVITNQKRASDRRNNAWARRVVPVRFAGRR